MPKRQEKRGGAGGNVATEINPNGKRFAQLHCETDVYQVEDSMVRLSVNPRSGRKHQ